jgi:hypothetical protein
MKDIIEERWLGYEFFFKKINQTIYNVYNILHTSIVISNNL